MSNPPIYPLLFNPIYQYRLWGGRKLAKLLAKPLPKGEPIGEAWLLSDRADHASQVLNGSLKGMTITDLMKHYQTVLMGKFADHYERFPLLLKFLDCKEVLSVQVHPADDQLQSSPPALAHSGVRVVRCARSTRYPRRYADYTDSRHIELNQKR